MINEQPERERFEQLLPGYVCNRLDRSDREWLEQFVRAHPELATHVAIEEGLRDVLRSEIPRAPGRQGLEGFMACVRADGKAPSSNWLQRFRESFALPMMKPAWAALGTLVIVQSGIIAFLVAARSGTGELLMSEAEPVPWRSVSPAPAAPSGPVLQISFKPTATEAEIRLLLVRIRGSIVAGPGQLGHYIVRIEDGQVAATAQELSTHPILEAVEVLPEIPQKD
ncbi:hypothetical protein [Methyloterricola oryzae]|uniref:hypothetical protein n=1 Tax=Methyloterricola oryzae TaxID=1495050 RepID=UPI0005EBBFB9|nr:hypothetical protein [Methyloterricola oryzae]